jgi:hypothetical protein
MSSGSRKSLLRSPRVVCVLFLFVVKTALMSVSTRSVEAVMFLEVFSLQIWALPSDVGST